MNSLKVKLENNFQKINKVTSKEDSLILKDKLMDFWKEKFISQLKTQKEEKDSLITAVCLTKKKFKLLSFKRKSKTSNKD